MMDKKRIIHKINIKMEKMPKKIKWLGEMVSEIEKANPNVMIEIDLLVK